MELNTRNENCTVNSQAENGTDGSPKEDGTDGSRKEDGTNDSPKKDGSDDSPKEDGTDGREKEDGPDESCNKNDEASLFYGTIETHESEGGEADLHKHFVGCKKNPGHTNFVPVKNFNIYHLPEGYQDNDLLDYIKATADLTVRLTVTMTSTERPEFLPNTNVPYPWYDKRESKARRLGTGTVYNIMMWPLQKNSLVFECKKCQKSDTPSEVWGQVWVYTAIHVVFDKLEARHTTCRLFFDVEDSPLVTLDGWTAIVEAVVDDHCLLMCVTCDLHLLDTLKNMLSKRNDLYTKVHSKYRNYRDKDRFTFIVSHPHGYSKQVAIGKWTKRCKLRDGKTKCMYTTSTCPGSSGATVHCLGYAGLAYYRHVHSRGNADGTNYSAAGRELA